MTNRALSPIFIGLDVLTSTAKSFDLAIEKTKIITKYKSFGISRPTAYKLIGSFEKQGFEALREQSRAPGKHPNATPQNIVDGILNLKKKHKY